MPKAAVIFILVYFHRVRVEAAQDVFFRSTLTSPLIYALHKIDRAADLELDVLLVGRVYIGH